REDLDAVRNLRHRGGGRLRGRLRLRGGLGLGGGLRLGGGLGCRGGVLDDGGRRGRDVAQTVAARRDAGAEVDRARGGEVLDLLALEGAVHGGLPDVGR